MGRQDTPLHAQDRAAPGSVDLLEGGGGFKDWGTPPYRLQSPGLGRAQDTLCPVSRPAGVSGTPDPPPFSHRHFKDVPPLLSEPWGRRLDCWGVGIMGFWGGQGLVLGGGRAGVRFFCMTVTCCSCLSFVNTYKCRVGGTESTFCHLYLQDKEVRSLSVNPCPTPPCPSSLAPSPCPASWLVPKPAILAPGRCWVWAQRWDPKGQDEDRPHPHPRGPSRSPGSGPD